MEDEVTPEALRPQRARAELVQSPPAPPPCFNPPAESPPDPAASISPPSSTEPSPQTSTSNIHELLDSSSGPTSPVSIIPRRPDLRAVQRVSDDVILPSPGTESQGSASGSPAGSEGGEHLQEMRERLLSESSTSTISRRDSDPTPRASMDINVTAPTPPLPAEEQEQKSSPEAGPSRLRTSPLSTHSPQLQSLDAATEQSWDSVWPASVQPRQLAPDHNVPPFSPAPISPFVTPTFSAPAPLVNRKPMSPNLPPGSPNAKRATSPVRYSPRAMSASSDGSSSTHARSPTHPSSSRHTRAQSSGSTMMRPALDQSLRPVSPTGSTGSPAQGEMLASTSKQRINDSLSRRSDTQSPPHGRPRTASSGSGARPRRTSFGDSQSLRLDPETLHKEQQPPPPQTMHEEDIPPLPPTGSFSALPPAVASPPFTLSGDDGSVSSEQLFSPPLVASLSRPATLRRALSDYDPHQRSAPSPFHRTLSVTTELDKSPTQPPISRNSPDDRRTASPALRPSALPPAVADGQTHLPDSAPPVVHDEVGDLNLVDEGDVLPTGDYQMDVTFDDEGLNTLERIFLLSQSDFGFHRAYVARVLGDLLEDVDPCESVEYVLPLLNGYSVDEDETVKEAFSSELHRILWYFFSTCRLTSEPGEIMTVTSEGVEMVPKPTLDELPSMPAIDTTRRGSVISAGGPSSAGSSLTNPKSSLFEQSDSDTPNSVTSISSDQTAFSPLPYVDANIGTGSAKEPAQLVAQPELPIGSFTPLLGNLMLSPNPVVGDHTRDAIIAVISRLRGTLDEEKWIRAVGDQDKRKTYSSQNGYHAHDLRPFAPDVKLKVETELLNGIVLGMGRLSTDLPESYLEAESDGQSHPDSDTPFLSDDAEAFKIQLVQEAEAGRAISLFLIGSLCDVYSGQEVVERGFLDEMLRATNGDETTRTEGAVALSRMAKIVPTDRLDEILVAFDTFVNDGSPSVRQAVAVALPAIAKRLDDTPRRRDFAVQGVTTLMHSGPDCRCSVMEILGELIYLFHETSEGPPQELLDYYWDDSDTKEVFPGDCVWDIIATYNFPGVCLTLGPDRWPQLRQLLQRLQDRGGEKVLSTIASFLHELAKILRPEQVAEDLLPVYTRLIDSKDDMRERVFEHVDDFITGLPGELAWMTFLGLAEAWKCDTLGGWRAREAVALHIPAFIKLFVARDIDIKPILDMTSAALLDKFAAVRDAAVQSVPQSYMTLMNTRFDEPFREMLLDLSNASSYRQRVTFTRCLKEFIKPPPHKEPFERFFAPALPRLRTDVVDVRIALAQIVASLFVVGAYYGTETEIPPVISQLAQALAEDDAVDVRDTVRHIDLDRLRKGKGPATKGEEQVLGSEPEAEQSPHRPGLKPLPSSRSSTSDRADAQGVSAAAAHHGDSDSTPRVGMHRGSDTHRALNPFASSFRDAVEDTEEEE